MQKRYWLRGGLIGVGVALILLLLAFLSQSLIYLFLIPPMSFISYFFSSFLNDSLISFVLSYFITGSILGWLYGKIKSRGYVIKW